MKTSSQLLLTFLLNACWQITLIAALASFGAWLLRSSSARYRHWVWVGGLCLAFLVPALTSSRMLVDSAVETNPGIAITTPPAAPFAVDTQSISSTVPTTAPAKVFHLNQVVAFGLLGIYLAFVLYSIFKLIRAWQSTRTIRHAAVELKTNGHVASVIRRCELEFNKRPDAVRVYRSETLPVPVTTGLFQPLIILPESLLHEGNIELLTTAIGHEFVHVARRDYVLNFVYELLFIPISFHPAAAFLRRRVKQTRELCCDELVAERILNAEVYARSLVRLASSAPPLRRLSVTTTVGIADADILEARIMSLLKKPELNTRWKKLLLVVVTLLLLVPCAAAASFAMRFDVQTNAQEPATSSQDQKREEKEKVEMKVRTGRTEEMRDFGEDADPRVRVERARREEIETEMREVRQAALVRLAKINMDQAIQIATSQQPGKVLYCILDASHWEEPGKLAKDGFVFYRVIMANETEGGAIHVWVNAIDGTVIKIEKEGPRKVRSPE